jgi:hypothetical protein
MSDAGGQITHRGVLYQDKIAALYLGRMLDPRAAHLPLDQQVVEVRGEKPGVEVDDVVVRFADGHMIYIQAKTALEDNGKTWEKLWEHFYKQHQPPFDRSKDLIILLMGDYADWYKALKTVCRKASSSQSVQEWQTRLSSEKAQKTDSILDLLNKLLQAEYQHDLVKAKDQARPEPPIPIPLAMEDLYRLFGCIDLRFIENETIEEEQLVYWIPDSNRNLAALFSHLCSLVLSCSSEGRSFRSEGLQGELARLEVTVKPLEQQRDIPLVKRNDYYAHKRLPDNLVLRPELLDEVRQAILDNPDGVALTSAMQMRALQGIGGIGKTVMARLLCDDPQVQEEYTDGILWATLGQHPDIRQCLKEWADTLGVRLDIFSPSEDQYKAALMQTLKEKRVLLIVDDAWRDEHLEYFEVGGPGCQLLITTRIPALAERAGAELCRVPPMTQAEAVKLLEQWARGKLDDAPYEEKLVVVERLSRLPLAIKLAGAKLKSMSPQDWLKQFNKLRRLDVEPDSADPEKSLAASFQLSLDGLSEKHQQLYQALGIFPEDEAIPEIPIIRIWQALDPNKDPGDCIDLLDYLGGMALLERSDEDVRLISLHDLLRQYLRERLGEVGQRLMHENLLVTYATMKSGAGWHTAPDDSYLYAHLTYHLAESKKFDDLLSLFWNDAWLHARVANDGYKYTGYLSDLKLAWEHTYQVTVEQIRDDKPLRGMVDCIHLALVRTTINSLSANYVPAIVAKAVALGIEGWTAERAYSMALQIPDAIKRYEMFLELLDVEEGATGLELAWEQRQMAIEQALQAALAIGDEGSRFWSLSKLAEKLEGEQVERALQAALAIGDERSRARALSGLAEKLEGEQRQMALELALQAALAIEDEWFRAEALSELAEQLEGEQVERALQAALAVRDEWSRARALSGLAEKLEGEQRQMAIEMALQAALAIEGEWYRAEALSGLAEQLEGEQRQMALELALQAALAIEDEWLRAEALSGLAEKLEGEQVERALQAALAIRDEDSRARALRRLAEQLEGEQRQMAIEMALQAALAIEDEGYRARALSGLAEKLEGEQVERALQAALAIEDKGSRAEALSGLAEQLEGEQVERALQAALAIEVEWYRARALGGLAEQLEGEQRQMAIERALQAALAIGDEGSRYWALSGLAEKLEREQVERVLQAALAIGDEGSRSEVLSGLAEKLEGEQRQMALELALQAALAVRDEWSRARALSGLAEQLEGEQRQMALELALQAALAIEGEWYRAEALSGLAEQLEGEQVERALQAALAIGDERSRAEALSGLAERLEGERQMSSWRCRRRWRSGMKGPAIGR